jgi:SAM-dependent methyltransferase
MAAGESSGRWAERAASLYDAGYAKRYRDRDDQLENVRSNQELIGWLGGVCDRFDHPIDVLDLGCGTGRYFWGLRRVSSLTGIDASQAMLDEARHPLHGDRLAGVPVTLVRGDLLSHDFAAGSFDLVYSIGVLAEHVPLTSQVVDTVHRWLKRGGRFAFTTVHPDSPSIARTPQRQLATVGIRLLPGVLTAALHRRLVGAGTYGDERWITELLRHRFEIEELSRFESDVHLHGRCVAVKA